MTMTPAQGSDDTRRTGDDRRSDDRRAMPRVGGAPDRRAGDRRSVADRRSEPRG